MPSTQEMLSFYRDWDRDLFDLEVRDASGWKRLAVAPLHEQAPANRKANCAWMAPANREANCAWTAAPRRTVARNGKRFAAASTVRRPSSTTLHG
jgi:hypothetical protein